MTTIESNITTYGTRDLIYGGLTSDRLGHACMVGWEYPITSIGNIALFKIKVEPAPTLTIRQVAGLVGLDWNHGVLQTADDVAGPWMDVANASFPMLVQPLPPQKFFRSRF